MKYYLSSYRDKDHYSYNLLKASLLQKLIRRSMVEEANYIASLYIKDNQAKALKRRLQIIAAEDIGLGWTESILFIESEPDLIKVTSALAQSPKNRESDRFLLNVINNKNILKNNDPQVIKEVSYFKDLVKKLNTWFIDKNKTTLSNLKSEFEKILKEDFKNKNVVNQLFNNYIELTRANVHGARCQIALAVLIITRDYDIKEFVPDLSKINIKEFDEIYDFAIDMHTPIGKKLKRGFSHWIKECIKVAPEVTYPELYDIFGNEKYPLTEESNKKLNFS